MKRSQLLRLFSVLTVLFLGGLFVLQSHPEWSGGGAASAPEGGAVEPTRAAPAVSPAPRSSPASASVPVSSRLCLNDHSLLFLRFGASEQPLVLE